MTATSTPSERVFSDAATMLRRPEPTKERVEPTTLGITAVASPDLKFGGGQKVWGG